MDSPNINAPIIISNPPPQPPAPPSRLATVKNFVAANKWYIVAIIAGLIVIIGLGWLAFRPQKATPQAAQVDLSIDAPETAPAGSQVVYKVKAENRDNIKLVGGELELIYAPDMSYVSSVPSAENLSGTLFPVPDLNPGDNAVIAVKVQISGSINDQKDLLARLHYRYTNFTSEFVKETSKTIRLTATDVALQMTGPASTNNAQLVSYDLNYVNNADHAISSARIQLMYPDGFNFATGIPQPDVGNNIWNIGTINPGQQGKITFQGTFNSTSPGQSLTFTADLQTKDQQGQFYSQAEAKFSTAISSLPLLVAQQLTQHDGTIVNPGDQLQYKLHYQNNAATVATGVNIVVSLDSKALDLSTLSAEGGQISGSTITWNAASVSNLETLNPSEGGDVGFSVTLRNPAVRDSSTNLTVKTAVKIKANEYATYLPGNDLSLKVATQASSQSTLAFASGARPPQVGKVSTYQIAVTLRNTTDDISNSLVTAFVPLPAGAVDVKSVNSKESGKVTYDPATGKVTWQVGTLSAHSGDFNPVRKLTFNVHFTPASSQVGSEVLLIRNIAFTGHDVFTGQNLQFGAHDLTTNDLPDNSDGQVTN